MSLEKSLLGLSGLDLQLDPFAVLQVGVPVEGVQGEEGQREDDPGDLVDLGHRVQSLFRIVERPDDASLAPTFLLALPELPPLPLLLPPLTGLLQPGHHRPDQSCNRESTLSICTDTRGATRKVLTRKVLTRKVLTGKVLTRKVRTRKVQTRKDLTRKVLTRKVLTGKVLTRKVLTREVQTRKVLTRKALTRKVLKVLLTLEIS